MAKRASYLDKMIDKVLRMFARENFGSGDKYYPVFHGETETTKPLALVIKRPRPIWKRPFSKMEMIILDGLEKYVESDKVQMYHEAVKTKITQEDLLVKDKFAPAARHQTINVDVGEIGNISLELKDDLGALLLGKLSQEYTTDPDLCDILANTFLDSTKMDRYKEQHLLLITSVVYSEKFEVHGEMKHQVELGAEIELPPQIAKILIPKLTAHYKDTFIPPGIATRSIRGPILFKCCRVDYDKETGRLKIHEGEFVGKCRGQDPAEQQQNECYEAVMNLETDETDLPEYFIADDIQKLETIKEEVLMTETSRSRRKERVKKYLGWFEQVLVTNNQRDHKLMLNKEPLTMNDCKFLKSISVAALPNQTVLDLSSLCKEEIQGYGIVFKVLDDLTDEQWTELEMILDGARN